MNIRDARLAHVGALVAFVVLVYAILALTDPLYRRRLTEARQWCVDRMAQAHSSGDSLLVYPLRSATLAPTCAEALR